jgi:hypothetical protein
MARKYEREYRKFIMNLSTWVRKTKERIERLPEVEKLSQLTYEEWYAIFKEEALVKKIPSPPSPPPPRLLKEGENPESPSAISKPEKHSCGNCNNFHRSFPPHDDYCDKKHSGYFINKTNNCEDYDKRNK